MYAIKNIVCKYCSDRWNKLCWFWLYSSNHVYDILPFVILTWKDQFCSTLDHLTYSSIISLIDIVLHLSLCAVCKRFRILPPIFLGSNFTILNRWFSARLYSSALDKWLPKLNIFIKSQITSIGIRQELQISRVRPWPKIAAMTVILRTYYLFIEKTQTNSEQMNQR